MDEILNFLQENRPFYVSTTDGSSPRVRPMGFTAIFDGKLIFATSKNGKLFAQLTANPKAEISVASKDNRWIRLNGTIDFIDEPETKERIVAAEPNLKNFGGVEEIAVFCVTEAEATFYSFTEAPRTVRF
jgi:uncharacterized pyridoxamine 5'-phosphate oxidase family protein